jgi:hypothetical protein
MICFHQYREKAGGALSMQSDAAGPGPDALARAMADFADAIFPGDSLFPSASDAGAHGVMAARLGERAGRDVPARLARAFLDRAKDGDPSAAAARLQVEEPALFETARTFLTFAYYEAPSVIAAIRALGHVYNDAPQPDGYALRPFDPAREAPAPARGAYVRTGDVVRVDLSGIAVSPDGAA